MHRQYGSRIGVAIVLALAGTSLGHAEGATASGDIAAGQKIVVEKCSGCHAVGIKGASPLKAAPPFRTLHRKYPIADLAEALAEGITTGHNEMPEFVFSPVEIGAILAYLDSIADDRPAKD